LIAGGHHGALKLLPTSRHILHFEDEREGRERKVREREREIVREREREMKRKKRLSEEGRKRKRPFVKNSC